MSDQGGPTTDTQTSSDSDWHYALFVYLLAYNIGTVVFELAEPTSTGLAIGGATSAGLDWASRRKARLRSGVLGLVVFMLPILIAAVVIATPLND